MKLNRTAFLISFVVVALLASGVALAADDAEAFKRSLQLAHQGDMAFGAGLAMGLAVLGGGLGQGIAVRGGLEGIARNPQASSVVTNSMLLGLAFVESLVIFCLIMAMFINGTI